MKKLACCLVALAGLVVGSAHAAEPKRGQPTCGEKIASMAAIPAKLAEGAESVAEMWEAHSALMGNDKESQAEVKGLRPLIKGHKQIAASLRKESEEMKKAASWPAAPHDMEKMMSDPKAAAAMQKLMQVHKDIIALMQKSLADMEAMHKQAK
jgi:hypothetical protein